MSSQRSAPPLQIDLRASSLLTVMVMVLHVAAMLLVLWLPLAGGWRVLLTIAIIYSAGHALVFHVLRCTATSPRRLIWHGDGHWTLISRNGRQSPVDLLTDSYVHARLVILNLRRDGHRLSLVLMPDAVNRQLLRRLRLRLLLEGVPKQEVMPG